MQGPADVAVDDCPLSCTPPNPGTVHTAHYQAVGVGPEIGPDRAPIDRSVFEIAGTGVVSTRLRDRDLGRPAEL
jgi:hypothetical protein